MNLWNLKSKRRSDIRKIIYVAINHPLELPPLQVSMEQQHPDNKLLNLPNGLYLIALKLLGYPAPERPSK
jgi:hypothetical protein